MMHSHRVVAAALALALAACRGANEPEPEPTPTPTPVEIATASIIRPDVVPTPLVDLPPPPLSVIIGFPEGGVAIDEAARAAIDAVLASEQVKEDWPVVLRGHSDSGGRDADNLAISRRRANAVADYLVDHGVARDRISVIAFGEQNPIKPNARPDGTPDEEGRASNRRVEITIAPPAKTDATPGEEKEEGESEP